MTDAKIPTESRLLSDGSELGILDVTCPLCDGKGRLSRTFLYEQLGVRDMAKLATHTAKEAVNEISTSLWARYKETLDKQVGDQAHQLNSVIEKLKAERSELEVRNKALTASIGAKEEAAREAQKNKDQAMLLAEREKLQEQITKLTDSVNRMQAELDASKKTQQLEIQRATQDLTSQLASANLEAKRLGAEVASKEAALAELRGAKQERDRSSKGGIDFETAAGSALRVRIEKLGDLYQETRNQAGGTIPRCKTGDHLQTLNADSKGGGGLKIVYECKKEDGYTRSKAFVELDEARRNRQAEVGVFMMAAATVRNDVVAAREFSEPFARFGNDLLVVWDHEDESSNFVVDVTVSIARALALRNVTESETQADWTAIDKHVNGLQSQLDWFAKLNGWCQTIHDRTDDIEERLRIMREQIESDCRKLQENLSALRP